ncbi:MAG: carboxypeptidase regulatory-like domain-containing protein [Acidobacteriia bacterium]|nr:carboxypeptidase regulatory-like domain-containing protein [Terriglobia bacterium]
MSSRKTTAIWTILAFGIMGAILTIALLYRRQPVVLRGAVVQEDRDPNKQLPLADVQITATNSLGSGKSQSNPSGFFRLTLPKGLRRRQPVILQFRHKDYQPLDLDDFIGDKLYIARMVRIHQDTKAESGPGSVVSNARIRYSVKATTEANIGTAVKTFQVVNIGNKPCNQQPPCSPGGGKWKAAIGSLSVDAGEGNEFRNPRVSCIAGPCPFAKIEQENLSQDGRHFNVSVRNWSDTTTFLLEAEVVHRMTSDMVRESYPVIFGRALNFSLPAEAEGPSIEAEIDKEAIVFPLGPNLFLRWADCHSEVDKDQSKTYRCELKPGYQFQ